MHRYQRGHPAWKVHFSRILEREFIGLRVALFIDIGIPGRLHTNRRDVGASSKRRAFSDQLVSL
jgi:hypothetical protein